MTEFINCSSWNNRIIGPTTTANWTFDNVVIQGVSFDTVANWIFDDQYVKNKIINNPTPAISNNTASASIIGFNTSYDFANGVTGSTNAADITSTTPWRSAITSITVNGSSLPLAAYDATQSGKIVFYPAQSSLLQSFGSKTIVISATGYSDDSVVQNLASIPAPVIHGTMLSNGQLTFTFTNYTGLNFSVLATNDISAPLTNWPVIGTAVENPAGSGNYQFTNSAATNAQEFYILRQP